VLQKHHLQSFFKRLRYAQVAFTYFACGEYGTRTHRAHYHVLFFSYSPISTFVLEREWGYGSVHVGDVQPESIDYCLAYVLKGRKGLIRTDGRPPEFPLFSRGLGNAAVIEIIRTLAARSVLVVPREFRLYGKSWPLTRRHRLLVEDHGWDVAPITNEETLHEMEKALLVMQGVSHDSPEYLAWLEKRQEILSRSRSRRIRDYYKAHHGHQKDRNETL